MFTAFVAQLAKLVQIGGIARPNKSAIAGNERQCFIQCARQPVNQHGVIAEIGCRPRQFGYRGIRCL